MSEHAITRAGSDTASIDPAASSAGQTARCRKAGWLAGLARTALLFAAAVGLAVNARADFSCNVTVQGVLPYYEGSVNVLHSGRGDWTIICSLERAYTNGLTVTPTVCAAWMTLLLRAKKNNQLVQFWFPGTGACGAIGTYGSSPVPIYIGEVN